MIAKIGAFWAIKALLEFSSSHPLWATQRKKEKGDGKQNEKGQNSHKLLKENAWREAHDTTLSPD